MNTHRLEISGHRLVVRSNAQPDYVQRLASELDESVRQASAQGAGPVGTVLLVALAQADELRRLRTAHEQLRGELGASVARLSAGLMSLEIAPDA